MPPAIDVRQIVKRFGTFTAVNGITFSVERGEIFGLLGPNGAGKTTTILMLLGLTEADGGIWLANTTPNVRVAGCSRPTTASPNSVAGEMRASELWKAICSGLWMPSTRAMSFG